MPYVFKVALFSVQEILPDFRFPNANFSFDKWFFRRLLQKFWVMPVCELSELKSSGITGVILVTSSTVFPGYIEAAVSKIRQSGFTRKILVFSPLGAEYLGKKEIEGVYYFVTQDMTEIINKIREHCLLLL